MASYFNSETNRPYETFPVHYINTDPNTGSMRLSVEIHETIRTIESGEFIYMMYAAGVANDWNTVSEILERIPEDRANFFAERALSDANFEMQSNLAPRIDRILRARGEYPQEEIARETSVS